MALGDRLGVLDHGVLQQIGSPTELYRRPANLFVAGFLGWPPMNLLRGLLLPEDDKLLFSLPGSVDLPVRFPVDLLRCPALAALAGKPVVLGVRAEHLFTGSSLSGASLRGFIQSIRATGADKYVHVQVGEQRIIARFSPDFPGRNGEAIRLNFELGNACMFDPETGKAVA
jgi:ABC-type sugar transport system ATPase subunit